MSMSMATTSEDTLCALVRALASSEEAAIPGAPERLLHQMHAIACELVNECDAGCAVRCDAGCSGPAPLELTAFAADPYAEQDASDTADWPAADPFWHRSPQIMSPRILEWDYEGQLLARSQPGALAHAH